jgi:hypothetical protein
LLVSIGKQAKSKGDNAMIYKVFFKGLFVGEVFASKDEVIAIEKQGFVLKYEYETERR